SGHPQEIPILTKDKSPTRASDSSGETSTLERPTFAVPSHEETLISLATDPELPFASVGIYVKQERRGVTTYREYRQELIEQLFFSVLNNRFSDLSRKPGAPYLYAAAGSARPIRPTQLLYLTASFEEGKLAEALEGLAKEVRRIQLHGIGQMELDRAKAEILRQAEQNRKEQNTLPSSRFVRSYVEAFLQNTPVLGPEFAYRILRHLIPTISAAEVARLADLFLLPQNRVVLGSAPEKEASGFPSPDSLLQVLHQVASRHLEPYVEEPSITHLIDPQKLSEQEKKLREALAGTEGLRRVESPISQRYEAVEWVLANGARVVLKTTPFKADEVLFSAYALGGTSLAEDSDFFSAQFAPEVVEQSGLGEYTSTQIEKYLAGKLIQLTPSIDEVAFRFSGSSSVKDLETFFQLLRLYFSAPRYDERAIQRYLDQVRSSLRNRENSPDTRFSRLIQQTLRRGHPRSLPLTLERLPEVNPLRAYQYYQSYVSNPAAFTFVFVGSISPQELEPLLIRYIAPIPKREAPLSQVGERVGMLVDRELRFRTEPGEFTLKAGKETKSQVSLYINGEMDWSIQEMTKLNLLEDYLDIRLREVLREDTGGTYGVRLNLTSRRAPVPEYSLEISFGTSPDRVSELVNLLLEELRRLKRDPPLESDVAKIREQRLRLVERGRRENSFWRFFLAQELYYAEVDSLGRAVQTTASLASPTLSATTGAEGKQPVAAKSSTGSAGTGESFTGTLFEVWEQAARALTSQALQERIQKYFLEDRVLLFQLLPEDP
ncbi:MAG: insulinase family protein, partial [Spirochaetales bacterium]